MGRDQNPDDAGRGLPGAFQQPGALFARHPLVGHEQADFVLMLFEEFEAILRAAFATPLQAWESTDRVAEEPAEYIARPMVERLVSRPFRDVAFRRHVRGAYANRCAVTGFRLINGGGRPEVQAAHIRPVEADGPDTVRNGVALTGTAHWLFDRGLIAFEDDYAILISPHCVPEDFEKLILPGRRLLVPENQDWRPHSTYLRWHRENRFKI